MRQTAIFDFDGTLADSLAWFFGIVNEVARRHGLREVSAQEREALRGRSSLEILRELEVPIARMPLIAQDVRAMAARDIDHIRLFPWVPDLFEKLRSNGTAIAIVSSNSEANIKRVLGPQLDAMVEVYAAGASLFGKAAKMRRIIRRSGPPDRPATAVGDEVRDIEAARSIAIPSLAVAWGYATAGALAAAMPTRLIHHPDELAAWFCDPHQGAVGN